tara:strand:+ start:1899 stop:2216 length:318 start_codon:yes stop_codon:yes gene_type:complete
LSNSISDAFENLVVAKLLIRYLRVQFGLPEFVLVLFLVLIEVPVLPLNHIELLVEPLECGCDVIVVNPNVEFDGPLAVTSDCEFCVAYFNDVYNSSKHYAALFLA